MMAGGGPHLITRIAPKMVICHNGLVTSTFAWQRVCNTNRIKHTIQYGHVIYNYIIVFPLMLMGILSPIF